MGNGARWQGLEFRGVALLLALLGAKEIFAHDLDDVARIQVAQENVSSILVWKTSIIAPGDLLKAWG